MSVCWDCNECTVPLSESWMEAADWTAAGTPIMTSWIEMLEHWTFNGKVSHFNLKWFQLYQVYKKEESDYIYKKIIYPQGRASWNETEAFINPVNPKLKLRPLNKMDYSEHFAATLQTGHGTCNLIAPFSCEAHGCWVNGQVMYRLCLPCSKFNLPNGPVIITLNTDCLMLNYLSETH